MTTDSTSAPTGEKGDAASVLRAYLHLILGGLIVLALIGLLTPAVVKLREAGWRMRCQNNLKCLGIALHNYHDTYGTFPAGTVSSHSPAYEERLSWYVLLLPFVEQEKLYRDIDQTKAWDAQENQPATGVSVVLFRCPSRLNGDRPSPPNVTNYVGLAGVGLDATLYPAGNPRAGIFGYDRKHTLKDVTDGTDKTLLLIETGTMVGPWAAGGPATVRPVLPSLRPYLGPERQFGGTHRSRQPRLTMANAVFVDGSVRWLDESISPAVLEALATIAGGEEIPADF